MSRSDASANPLAISQIGHTSIKCMGCSRTFPSHRVFMIHSNHRLNVNKPCAQAAWAATTLWPDNQRPGGRAATQYGAQPRTRTARGDSQANSVNLNDSDSESDPDLESESDSDSEEGAAASLSARGDTDSHSESESMALCVDPPMTKTGLCGSMRSIHSMSAATGARGFRRLDPPPALKGKRFRDPPNKSIGLCAPEVRPDKITRTAAEVYNHYVASNLSQARGQHLWESCRNPGFTPGDIRTRSLLTFERLVQATYGTGLEITSVDLHQGA